MAARNPISIPARSAIALLLMFCLLIISTGCASRATLTRQASHHKSQATVKLPGTERGQYWLGVNYAWFNYGTDFGTGRWGKFTDWKQINSDFAAMHSQGAHIVRWWVFADGRYAPTFTKNGIVTGLDPSVLTDIDHALSLAEHNKITLLLTLIDSSMWGPAIQKGPVTQGGHAAMVMIDTVQESYLDNALKPLLLHIAASPWRAQVAGYDLVNEPESQINNFWGGSHLAVGAVKAFVLKCAAYVHTYSNGSFVTVGSATPYYVATWKNLGLDFYELHYYPQMDTPPALGEKPVPGNGLPSYASLGLDKPCIVGEFATMDAAYDSRNTKPFSAQWYLNSIQKRGYSGALAWSYRVHDKASNWPSFQPIFTQWNKTHAPKIAP